MKLDKFANVFLTFDLEYSILGKGFALSRDFFVCWELSACESESPLHQLKTVFMSKF